MRIGVVSGEFTAHYKRTMLGLLQKSAGPDQVLVEYALVRRDDLAYERERMLNLLHGPERPDVVLSLCFRPDPETMELYRAAGVPMVILDEEAEGASTVACDNLEGGLLAGRHLVAAGRRSLALICGRTGAGWLGDYNAVLRRRGLEKALAEAGLTLPPELVFDEVRDYVRRDGVNGLITLVGRGKPFDGIFCAAGDASATGILAAARERGLKVPDALAVVGFDDMPIASISEPPLTTLRQPLEAIARAAIALTREARAILAKPRTVLLKPTLVQRAST